MQMVDPILFRCYLRKRGDDRHCLLMTPGRLIILFKGQQQVFDLHQIKKIGITPKKLIILLVAGGIGTCFSMLAFSMGWYHYYLNMVSILGFFAMMYIGWIGRDALEIHEGKHTHFYLLGQELAEVRNAVSFIRKYSMIKRNRSQMIYHIAEQSSWESQIDSTAYIHDSLKTDGFIHSSVREEVMPTFERYFKSPGQYVLLIIDESQIEAKVEHEFVESRQTYFPHIFGPLNKTAIRRLVEFESLENLRYLVEETIPD